MPRCTPSHHVPGLAVGQHRTLVGASASACGCGFPAGAALLFILFSLVTVGLAAAPDADKLGFNRDVRPILSENCFPCHGPDKNQRKGKFRLDVRDAALAKEAFKPGKPGESELVRRIYTTNQDDLMPPPDSTKRLTASQKELLKHWIAQGAEYEPHWAYIKPIRPKIPGTKNPEWVQNPIDALVLHDLEDKNLRPSPPADKRTLIRRVSLDLIGLPPTAFEVREFVEDSSPAAYEKLVDRLLASPHYGERMAVPWLDLARFTDTVGYHGDQNQRIFPYRDYVIESFNRNKPFDQFTIEQLAGDLLPQPTVEQTVATGFNRLNMMTREGGAQPGEYLAKYGADRVRTVATTWLGSTMGCCECHDHKFDPFLTRDFYSMKAFFADIKQWGVYSDYNYTPNPDLKGWSNDHPFPPEIEVTSDYLRSRQSELRGEIDALLDSVGGKEEADAKIKAAFNDWRRRSLAFLRHEPDGWVTPVPEVHQTLKDARAGLDTAFIVQKDNTILFAGDPASKTEIKLPLSPGLVGALRLELLPNEIHQGNILVNTRKTTLVNISAKVKSPNEVKERSLDFYYADADEKEDRYANGEDIIGVKEGWKTSRQARAAEQTAVWLLEKPFTAREGDTLTVTLDKNDAGCLRVSVSPFAAMDLPQPGYSDELRKALTVGAFSRSDRGRRLLTEAFLIDSSWNEGFVSELTKLRHEVLECRNGRAFSMVTEAREPRTIRVLPRGNWQDESGAIVAPAVPHFLGEVPDPSGRRLTRLDLAQWLVSRDNPLTARAAMNRLWKQFFGAGISAVVDDLGAQGEWPTHPELLDWLAVEFMDSGWDFKRMVKTIVMSSTYRQSSNPRPEIHELDPANRLLAAQSPRRLEAEFVRDNALFISGLLNLDIGGPSAHPYQPAGYYSNLQFPDRDYYSDSDERQYRRGVYMHWQRTFLQPMLANFDAPARDECTAVRNVSNTPQQALTLLNDPTFFEAARVFAGRLLAGPLTTDAERLDFAYKNALARPIKPDEFASLERFLTNQREHYKTAPDEAKSMARVGLAAAPQGVPEVELAAWTEACRVVLNLHETITRY